MPKYVKKPIEVEALQFVEENFEEIREEPWNVKIYRRAGTPTDKTLFYGWVEIENRRIYQIELGDYVALDVEGKVYPIRESVFSETYEPVEG